MSDYHAVQFFGRISKIHDHCETKDWIMSLRTLASIYRCILKRTDYNGEGVEIAKK